MISHPATPPPGIAAVGFLGVTDPIIRISSTNYQLASTITGVMANPSFERYSDTKFIHPFSVSMASGDGNQTHSEIFDTAEERDAEFGRVFAEWSAYRERLDQSYRQ